MDQDTLRLLARLKVAARKTLALDIDIQRLTHDRPYASEVLHKATQTEDESLVLAAITLQDRFGLLKESPPREATAAPAAEGDAGKAKYKFGARG